MSRYNKMERILVIQTASLGDAILATALVESLHRSFPGAGIDMLVKKGNETLFSGHPYMNHILVWDKSAGKIKNFLRLVRQVRTERYDLVVNIQRFFLTGLLTVLSGSRESRGFSKNPFSCLFTHRFIHDIGNDIHETARNHRLVNDFTGQECGRPRLYPSPADKQAIEDLAKGRYYTISPASLWHTKQLPAEKWIGLVRQAAPDTRVYLLGSAGEQELCAMITEASGHTGAASLAGKLTLLQTVALMARARMNFTNDSAPMHLASAVNAPVTAVFCSTVPAFGFGPLSENSRIVETREKLTCRPCGLHGHPACPEKHFRCATGIAVDQLANRL